MSPNQTSLPVAGVHGRDRELARIAELLSEPRGATLMIRGIPGSGRSTLLHAAADRHSDAVTARGAAAEAALAFSGLDQLLSSDPRLAQHRDPIAGTDPAEAARSLAGLRTTLAGVLLAIDDFAFWDPSSRAVLAALQADPSSTVKVVIATHPGDALEGAASTAIDLQPLEDAAARAMLADRAPDLSDRDVMRVIDLAAGNPLALAELASTWDSNVGQGTTPQLELAFHRRFEALGPKARQALVALALLGDRGAVPRAIVREVGIDAGAFDELALAGLVRSDAEGAAFVHRAVGGAALAFCTSSEIRAVEALLGARLADPVQRLRHSAGAAVGYDPSMAERLEAASLAVAPRIAADLLERAARLDPAGRGRRLVHAAEFHLDSLDASQITPLIAAARKSGIDRPTAARAALAEAAVAVGRRIPSDPFRMLLDSLDGFDVGDPKLRRAAQVALELAVWAGRPDWADSLAAAVPPAVGVTALIETTSRALRGEVAAIVPSAFDVVTLDGADELVAATIVMILSVDLAGSAGVVDHLNRLGSRAPMDSISVQALGALEHWHGARLQRSDASGETPWGVALRLARRAHAAVMLADARDCVEAATESKQLAVAFEFPFAAALAQWALGRLALQEGDSDTALILLSRIAERGSESSHPIIALLAAPDLLEAAYRNGSAADFASFAERMSAAVGVSEWAAMMSPRLAALVSPDPGIHFATAIDHAARAGSDLDEARVRLLYGEHLRRTRQRVLAREQLTLARDLFDRGGAASWSQRASRELEATSASVRRDSEAPELTPRERQIAELVATGAANQEIAVKLSMSRKTVEYHLHKTYSKLGIGSRAELAEKLAREDW